MRCASLEKREYEATLEEQTRRMDGRPISRGLEIAIFTSALGVAAAASAIAGRAGQGIAVRFGLGAGEPLLEAIFMLFLVVVGFRALDWTAAGGRRGEEVVALPRRRGWATEWGVGAATGWGLCLVAVLPLLLTGHLHARIVRGPAGEWISSIGLAVLTLAVGTLTVELVFRGYPFRRLMNAIGPSWAAVVTSVLFGGMLVWSNPPKHLLIAMIDCTLLGLLLAMAYLRTYALWVGWGLSFAYRVVAAMVLGLPFAGQGELASLAETSVSGPRWLTGGAFGLEAAVWTGLALLAAMIVLFRATKDYEWRYTHAEIVPAGYEVAIAPPAAHVAMEKAATPPPLVQILSTTPQTRSRIEAPELDAAGNLLPPR